MTNPRVRVTSALRGVLSVLLEDPTSEYYGLELARGADLPSGTLYPMLARLEAAGLVESRYEDPEIYRGAGRPPRRYYRLTGDGVPWARQAILPRHPGLRRAGGVRSPAEGK